MKKFSLGDGVRCDLGVLIDTRALIQANSGGGKSWCLRRLMEQTHGRVQHLVIDPEGEFASLREKFDYVYAAKHGGDTAADPRSAKMLAERLLELGVSAIIDIYELKAHDRIRFVRLFLEALVDSPKRLWHPALIVLDEAHVYCPQKGEAESANAVIDLATRGRKRGFCAIMATQRLSKLHKDAAAELNNKFIGRTGLDVDMARAGEELGFTSRDERLRLRSLKPGEFFVFGPAVSESVRRCKIGAVSTRHPKAGARLSTVAPPPTKKVRKLLPKLADLPAEAEARTRTQAELKKEIAQLKREVSMAKRAAPTQPKPVAAPARVDLLAIDKAIDKAIHEYSDLIGKVMDDHLGKVRTSASKIVVEAQSLLKLKLQVAKISRQARSRLQPPSQRVEPKATRPKVDRATHQSTPSNNGERADLSGPEKRILDATAWIESIGIKEPNQTAVAFIAGYTFGGGGFNNPKGRLHRLGYVDYCGGRIVLTDAGRSIAEVPDEALTPEEIQKRVLDRLPGPETKILTPLLQSYPEQMSKADLAEQAGYSLGGGFNNPLGRLRSIGLINYPSPGYAVALPLLFLEGNE